MSWSLPALLRMAQRNVRRNWRHSFAAILSIATGFVAIALFEGYLNNLAARHMEEFARRAMYGDVLVQRRGASSAEARERPFDYLLQAREQRFLNEYLTAHASDVVTRARFLELSGVATTGDVNAMFMGVGYDVREGAQLRGADVRDLVAGNPLEQASPEAVLLARGLARQLDCSLPDATGGSGSERPRSFACPNGRVQLTITTETGQLNAAQPEVAGIKAVMLKELDDSLLYLPLQAAQSLLDTSGVSLYSIALKGGTPAGTFAAQLSAAAAEQGLELEATPWRAHKHAQMLNEGLELLGAFRSFVLVIVIVVAGSSVVVTMVKLVGERIREIGTLRALGFRRRHVLLIFALESLLLGLLAIAVGLVATLLLTLGVNLAQIEYKAGLLAESIPLSIAYGLQTYAWASALLLCIVLIAALWPARRAARLGISNALADA